MRFSLRGKIKDIDTNATPVQTQIFDYVSSDRRKGWKVVEAYVWPITPRTTAGGAADGTNAADEAAGACGENRLFASSNNVRTACDCRNDSPIDGPRWPDDKSNAPGS